MLLWQPLCFWRVPVVRPTPQQENIQEGCCFGGCGSVSCKPWCSLRHCERLSVATASRPEGSSAYLPSMPAALFPFDLLDCPCPALPPAAPLAVSLLLLLLALPCPWSRLA